MEKSCGVGIPADMKINEMQFTILLVLMLLQRRNVNPSATFFDGKSHGVWLGGRVVRTLDLQSAGREFESRPPRC